MERTKRVSRCSSTIHLMECKGNESPSSSSSSMDSCGGEPPPVSTASPSGHRRAIGRGLWDCTDLHLGLSLRSSCSSSSCIQTDNDNAPCTPRSALTTAADPAYERAGGSADGGHGRDPSLFVKVYMDGVPIGRKLDLLLLDGYDGLLAQLRRMFMASITYPDVVGSGGHDREVLGEKLQQQQARHVLTYEDQEGDWMMVGDLPWELFLKSVKKLRIARVDKYYIN